MQNDKTLSDYREILEGWENDVQEASARMSAIIDELIAARSELVTATQHADKLRGMIAEMERLNQLNDAPKGSLADVAPGFANA